MAAKFTREHYEALAKAIGDGRVYGGVVASITAMLARDNPDFNRSMFRSAIDARFEDQKIPGGRHGAEMGRS